MSQTWQFQNSSDSSCSTEHSILKNQGNVYAIAVNHKMNNNNC